MVEKPIFVPQPLNSIGTQQKPAKEQNTLFQQVLKQEMHQTQELKFSRHALERLNARSITLDKECLSRLNEAVSRAQAKGSRESLVLLDDLAFVVSVKNKTVITAVDGEHRKENVFTNIDSAVIN